MRVDFLLLAVVVIVVASVSPNRESRRGRGRSRRSYRSKELSPSSINAKGSFELSQSRLRKEGSVSVLDLSGLHHLGGNPVIADRLEAAVASLLKGKEIPREEETEPQRRTVIAVDASQSALRDEDFDRIVRVFFPVAAASAVEERHSSSNVTLVKNNAADEEGASSPMNDEMSPTMTTTVPALETPVGFRLAARGNQLTSVAVRTLVERILARRRHHNVSSSSSNSSNSGGSSSSSSRSSTRAVTGDLAANENNVTLSSSTDNVTDPLVPGDLNVTTAIREIESDGPLILTAPSALKPFLNRPSQQRRELEALDLSWNPLFLSGRDEKGERRGSSSSRRRGHDRLPSLSSSLRELVALPTLGLLRLDCCGLDPSHCRSIAKGLLDRCRGDEEASHAPSLAVSPSSFASPVTDREKDGIMKRRHIRSVPLSLHLSGNGAVGDAGAAALAAALRTIIRSRIARTLPSDGKGNSTSDSPVAILVLDALDLSGCGIGDAGAEALALALEGLQCTDDSEQRYEGNVARQENIPLIVIRKLDLSHNRISSAGAAALGRALRASIPTVSSRNGDSSSSPSSGIVLHGLDLSDNTDVGDKGASEIAAALTAGRLTFVSMRSCNIYADGAAAFGKALRQVALLGPSESRDTLEVDLSGNPLGVLRGKKKDDGKYSASRLKSKASATAASYVNQGMSFLRKNLKDVGVDVTPIFGGTSAESDDEEEKTLMERVDEDYDPSKGRCGAKALANRFIEAVEQEVGSRRVSSSFLKRVRLGLRHCFFDHSGADALAALLVTARDKASIDLELDVSLNSILEEDMVSALDGNRDADDLLREMAERHFDALEALKEARARAAQASAAAASRARVHAQDYDRYEDEGETATSVRGSESDEDGSRDSDAEYENGDSF